MYNNFTGTGKGTGEISVHKQMASDRLCFWDSVKINGTEKSSFFNICTYRHLITFDCEKC